MFGLAVALLLESNYPTLIVAADVSLWLFRNTKLLA